MEKDYKRLLTSLLTADGSSFFIINPQSWKSKLLRLVNGEPSSVYQDILWQDYFDKMMAFVAQQDRENLRESLGCKALAAISAGETASAVYHSAKNGDCYISRATCTLENDVPIISIYTRKISTKLSDRREVEEAQRKLREQEEHTAHMNHVLQSLCADYSTVYDVDLSADKLIPLRLNERMERAYGEAFRKLPYSVAMNMYADAAVLAEDRDAFKHDLSIENLREVLDKKDRYSVFYRSMEKGSMNYYQLKVAKYGDRGSEHIVGAFLNVTEETLERSRAAEESRRQLEIISGLTQNYVSVSYIDLKSSSINILVRPQVYSKSEIAKFVVDEKCSISAYESGMRTYFGSIVSESDRSRMTPYSDIEYIKRCLEVNDTITESFRCGKNFMQLQLVRVTDCSCMVGFLLGLVDISETMEEEMERELAHKKELSDALVLAHEASEAKTVFLSNMSHDMRTPLNAILGYAAMAKRDEELPERLSETLDKIEAAGQYLLQMINDVLDMACVESGKLSVEESPCIIEEQVAGLASIMQAEAQERRIELSVELDVQHSYVYCDALRMRQISMNLLSNAFRYTSAGGRVNYRVMEIPCEKAGCASYEIHVNDTGIGMSSDLKKELFTGYIYGHRSSEGGRGAGMGLAITKKIVDRMGGKIKVESEQGKGSEFIVTLTLRLVGSEYDAAGTDDLRGDYSGLRVLLAEDVSECRQAAAKLLCGMGFAVEYAENGSDALEMLSSSESGYYSLVIMDTNMPVMDGYAAVREIRSLQNRAHASVPVVALTADAIGNSRQKPLEIGFDAALAKPIDSRQLKKILSQLLQDI